MNSTALCLQHVPFEGPGVFEQALGELGFPLTRRLVPAEGLPSRPPDFLLAMGGPMSANDPDPWIADELRFIRRTVEAGVPFLGICLGSQLLAKAMGGRVYKGPSVEIGMTRIALTDAGRTDPMFASTPSPLDVFEWHGEGIEAPPGATVLASSKLFPVQAFRCGPKALGLLFHAELEESGIRTLCEKCPEDAAKAGLDAKAILAAAKPRLPGLQGWARGMVRGLILNS